MFQINSASGVPIYEQLIQNILRLASAKVLKPHDKLPSVRSLATDLGINPNTVAKAYRELEAQGVIYSVTGKGSFVNEQPQAANETEALRSELRQVCSHANKSGVSAERLKQMIDELYEGGQGND